MKTKIINSNLELIERKRFERYISNDKDPYICYRFVARLEHLLPPKFSQIKLVSAIPEGELSGEQMIIETDPIKVAERYIQQPFYEDIRIRPDDKWYLEIKELAHHYMDYLYSNALDRLKYYDEDRKKWEKFI